LYLFKEQIEDPNICDHKNIKAFLEQQ